MAARTRPPEQPDPSAVWIEETLSHIVRYQQSPVRATRALALIAAALNDSIIASQDQDDSRTDALAAAHSATATSLAHLYPQDSPGKLRAKGLYLAS